MKKKIFWEMLTVILVIITITITLLILLGKIDLSRKFSLILIIDNLLTLYFIIEYLTRLYLSDNRKHFIKNNKLDLLSTIPFNTFFKKFKLLKMIKFLKLTKLKKIKKIVKVMKNE